MSVSPKLKAICPASTGARIVETSSWTRKSRPDQESLLQRWLAPRRHQHVARGPAQGLHAHSLDQEERG